MNEHISRCKYRNVNCKECQQDFRVVDCKQHREICPDRLVLCSKQCGERILQKNVTLHLNTECLSVEAPCQHQHFGCDFVGKRVYHSPHLKVCVYEKLKAYLIQNQQVIKKLQEQTEIQSCKINKLELLVEQQAEEIRSLKKRPRATPQPEGGNFYRANSQPISRPQPGHNLLHTFLSDEENNLSYVFTSL